MKGKVMIELLRDKKGIFFDVGYTLAYPSLADCMFTNIIWRAQPSSG